jgi:hypothetical protein
MKKMFYIVICLNLVGVFSPLQSAVSQERDVHKLMVDKLKTAQQLLEGLAMSDFDKIGRNANHLMELSKSAEWLIRKTPRYEMHSNEFRRACDVMAKRAKEKNLDGVALAYMDMTMTCVRCHEYVRDVRDARLQSTTPERLAQGSRRDAP